MHSEHCCGENCVSDFLYKSWFVFYEILKKNIHKIIEKLPVF